MERSDENGMRSSRSQPAEVIFAAESQKKSGELSSFPVVSSLTESYWMPRALERKRMAVFPSLRVSRITPP